MCSIIYLQKEILWKIFFDIFDQCCLTCKCNCDRNKTLIKTIDTISRVCKDWKEFVTSKYFTYQFFKKYHVEKQYSMSISGGGSTYCTVESIDICLCDKRPTDDENKELLRKINITDICSQSEVLSEERLTIYDDIEYKPPVYSHVPVPHFDTNLENRMKQFREYVIQNYRAQGYVPINRVLEGPNVIPFNPEDEKVMEMDEATKNETTNSPIMNENPDKAERDKFLNSINEKVDKMQMSEVNAELDKLIKLRERTLSEMIESMEPNSPEDYQIPGFTITKYVEPGYERYF